MYLPISRQDFLTLSKACDGNYGYAGIAEEMESNRGFLDEDTDDDI